MSLRKTSGFTIIELLVTLVILSLATGLVVPNIMSWLASREAASKRAALANTLALLPLEANRTGSKLVINSADQLSLDDTTLTFSKPIEVQQNGFCSGDSVTLSIGDRVYQYRVLSPYCQIERISVGIIK